MTYSNEEETLYRNYGQVSIPGALFDMKKDFFLFKLTL